MADRQRGGVAAKLGKAFDGVLRVTGYASAVLIVLVTLLLLCEVVARYILHRPTTWALDTALFALLYLALLGSAWLLKEEGHVKIELITSRFSAKTQVLITGITSVIASLSCGIFCWQATSCTLDAYQRGYFIDRAITVPRYLLFWVIAFGTFLLCIQFARRAYQHFRILSRPISEETNQ